MSSHFEPKNIFKILLKKDYLYLVMFFCIITVFVYFVIYPNLRQLVLAGKKLDELKNINKQSDLAINKIITIQSNIEKLRNDFIFLDELIFKKPAINNFLSDVESSLLQNNLKLSKLFINDVDLIRKTDQEKPTLIIIKGEVTGSFSDFYNFIKEINKQTRLKEFEKFEVIRENESTESSSLRIKFELKTNYL